MGKILRKLKILLHPSLVRQKIYSVYWSRKLHSQNLLVLPTVRHIDSWRRVKVGESTRFGRKIMIGAHAHYRGFTYDPQIEIGPRCSFGDYTHITCIDSIKIGEEVLTGQFVLISDNNHGEVDYESLQEAPLERELTSRGPVRIGARVWIGDKVSILGGVNIGEGAVIGSNSVVTKDVPPYCVAAGVPARVIKDLRPKSQ